MREIHLAIPWRLLLLLATPVIFLTIPVGYFLEKKLELSPEIQKVEGGLSVCFQRVIQSFTAAMMESARSPYLSPKFLQQSGLCIGKVQNMLERIDQKGLELRPLLQQGNRLVSQVGRFHNTLNMMGPSQVNRDFVKLEKTFKSFRDSLQNQKTNHWTEIFRDAGGLKALIIVMTLLTSCLLFFYSKETFTGISLHKALRNAGNQEQKRFIVQRAMSHFELPQTLLTHLFGKPENGEKNSTENPMQQPKVSPKFQATTADVVELCLEKLANKTFAVGAKIEIQGELNELVPDQESMEAIQQIFYLSLDQVIREYRYLGSEAHKIIVISVAESAEKAKLVLRYYGPGPDQREFKYLQSPDLAAEKLDRPSGYIMMANLGHELGRPLVVKKMRQEDKQLIEIKIPLRSQGQWSARKLVRLVKGTKRQMRKDLKKEIRNEAAV